MALSKADLIASLQNEVRILVHLCSKVEPTMLDFRPTPKQRSTIELLRYLTVMGPMIVPSVKAGAFARDTFQAGIAASAELGFAAVVKSLETQSAFYAEAVGAFTEQDFAEQVDLFGSGQKMSRALWLINFVVCGHAAYRSQLFDNLKACGREELGTMNLWMGIDPPKK